MTDDAGRWQKDGCHEGVLKQNRSYFAATKTCMYAGQKSIKHLQTHEATAESSVFTVGFKKIA